MIEHIKIFLPTGQSLIELHSGVDGVKKIFFDRDDLSTLVVTTEDNIVTYRGFSYICQKAYAVSKE